MNENPRGTGVPPVKAAHGRDGRATPPVPAEQCRDRQAALRIRQGAYLPHWTQEGGIYSVTFRLADALPQAVVGAWKAEREELLRLARQQGRPLRAAEERRLRELFSEKVEKYLDAGMGHCWMNRPDVADLASNALKHFDGARYLLLAWCVMPNHVHVVVKPAGGHELDKILHSWKSFTAHKAMKWLGLQASFWQPEYYDHLIRDDEDLLHAVEYTVNNPVAAGLREWRWVGMRDDLAQVLEDGTGVSPVELNHGRGTGVSPVELNHGRGTCVSPVELNHGRGTGVSSVELNHGRGTGVSPVELNHGRDARATE